VALQTHTVVAGARERLGAPSGERYGAIVFALCVAGFMAMLDVFVVNVAFPAIGGSFRGASLADLSWVLNAYTIVYAALLIPAGRLADRYGRKRAFMVGLVVFTVASLVCAGAPGLWWLVAARMIQAVGAAALTTAGLGLLLTVLPAERRAGAVKIWATTSSVAAALGPVVGGAVVLLSWRWVFLLNVPVGVAAFAAGRRLVPDLHDARAAKSVAVDLVGVVTLAVAIGAAALGLVKGGDWGWAGGSTLGAFGVGVAAAAVFVVRTLRHSAPVVDVALLRVPSFVWANVTVLLFCTAFSALFLSVVLWLQEGAGYSAIATGLAILPGPMSVPVFAAVAQRLVRRVSAGTVIAVGNVLFCVGALALAAGASADIRNWTQVLPGWVLTGVGIGLALPTTMASATAGLPVAQAGTGSAVINTGRQLGYVLGVAVFVAIVGAVGASHGVAPHTAFQHGWWFVAGTAALSAVTGVGVSGRRGAGRG
jgi:EmrB/QacA subfamily drug resistance transporter